MADELPKAMLRLEPSLYLAQAQDLYRLLLTVDERVDTVLALGHNPGWESLVSERSGQPTRFTTANAALFEVDVSSWADVVDGTWTLRDLLRPRPPRG